MRLWAWRGKRFTRAAAASLLFPLVTLVLTATAAPTPLLQLPGYELAELLTLFDAVAAGPLAASARARSPALSALGVARRVAVRLGLANLFTVAIIAARAALFSRCDPFASVSFLFLLPLPTLLLVSVLAAGVTATVRSARWALGIYFLGLVLLLVHGAWPAYAGPQAFGYDHLLGYVPGPLYDEALQPPFALWWFRGLSVALALVLGSVLAFRPRLVPWLFAFAVVATGPLEHRLGTRSSVADLDRALGATRSFQGLTIHAPRELSEARLQELLRAAAVARAQVAEALALLPTSPVDVFLHRSSQEKAVLTGAGETHFTKPWLRQIQTEVDAPQVLRHEMVHALAGQIAEGPFGVGRHLTFNIGIIEGLAEAIDWRAERYTLDEWCVGMRAAGMMLAPDALLRSSGAFYAAPQGKAYTVAGAFLRWLLDTRGLPAVLELYRDQDFVRDLGESLPALSEEFDRHLSAEPAPPALVRAATERFRVRPLYARPCGREVAVLRDEARQAEAGGDGIRAAALFGRCASLDPAEPSYLEARWRALRDAGAPAAEDAVRALLAAPTADDALRARVELSLGDDALERGQDFRAHYEEARTRGLDPSGERALHIRELAAEKPAVFRAIHRYLEAPNDPLLLTGLAESKALAPSFAPLPYLLGLALAARDRPEWAEAELSEAVALGLPDDLAGQAFRVEADLGLRTGQLTLAKDALEQLARVPESTAQRRQAEDLASRLAFQEKLFPAEVEPPDHRPTDAPP